MKMKKLVSLFLLAVMAVSVGSFSNTASASIISPLYENISDVSCDLDVDGNTLYVDAETYGYFDASKCGVTATLQKYSGSSWTKYRSWSATSPSSHPDFVMFSTKLNVSSGKYRLVTSHSVTVGNTTEYEGLMSDEVTVS